MRKKSSKISYWTGVENGRKFSNCLASKEAFVFGQTNTWCEWQSMWLHTVYAMPMFDFSPGILLVNEEQCTANVLIYLRCIVPMSTNSVATNGEKWKEKRQKMKQQQQRRRQNKNGKKRLELAYEIKHTSFVQIVIYVIILTGVTIMHVNSVTCQHGLKNTRICNTT